ncbi:MAG: 4Fe-4S dicluster domain-containing protein [Chloroflexota bacterium]
MDAPPKKEAMGFFTDSTLCIGCKACEVACKQWNGLPADGVEWSGQSYDNTRMLSSTTWRHVTFTEIAVPMLTAGGAVGGGTAAAQGVKWLFNSDVCKHCTEAPCQEVCPTGALIRNEFDDVYLQQDICNGCGYCVPTCPFGVLGRSEEDGKAHKCTLCYDRQKDGIEPACAKACPTDSILFGPVEELRLRAKERLGEVRMREPKAYLYGESDAGEYKRLNAFFLLTEEPAAYNLPEAPIMPTAGMGKKYMWSAAVGIGLSLMSAVVFGRKR